jgi:hypothetical protein
MDIYPTVVSRVEDAEADCMDSSVCVASIFRIIAVNEIDPHDFTFTNVGGGLWSTVEVEIGFICANLPAIRPLVFKLLKLKSSSNNRSAGTGPGAHYGYGHTNGGRAQCSNCGGSCVRCAGSPRSRLRTANDDLDLESNTGSDEIELTKTTTKERSRTGSIAGIRVQTDVEQTVAEWREPGGSTVGSDAMAGQKKHKIGLGSRGARAAQYGNKVDSFVIIQRASGAE